MNKKYLKQLEELLEIAKTGKIKFFCIAFGKIIMKRPVLADDISINLSLEHLVFGEWINRIGKDYNPHYKERDGWVTEDFLEPMDEDKSEAQIIQLIEDVGIEDVYEKLSMKVKIEELVKHIKEVKNE